MAEGLLPNGRDATVRVTFATRTGRRILITTILASGPFGIEPGTADAAG